MFQKPNPVVTSEEERRSRDVARRVSTFLAGDEPGLSRHPAFNL
jgi:hypothetical protein